MAFDVRGMWLTRRKATPPRFIRRPLVGVLLPVSLSADSRSKAGVDAADAGTGAVRGG